MDSLRKKAVEELKDRLGLTECKAETINTSLTHPTYAFENRHLGWEHNQRLEFLGDAVLGLVVGEYLFHHFPELPEGELTKMRAMVVCEASLARMARILGLGPLLLLGRGEEMNGGRERPSILADAFEALTGAVFLEAGYQAARRNVLKTLMEDLQSLTPGDYHDFKTMLQEYVQKETETNVTYAILHETGPDHDKRFVAGVSLKGRLLAEGFGRSKKEAEQEAARNALEKLRAGSS
ncbi:MAG: ribonuclease III [Bacillota bacterium]